MRYSCGVRLQVTDLKTTSFTCDCHSDEEGGRGPGRPAALGGGDELHAAAVVGDGEGAWRRGGPRPRFLARSES